MIDLCYDMTLPADAVTQTIAALGMRGTGKTNSGTVIVEGILEAGQHIVVIDPLGVWWGLRSTAAGDAAGLPIVIFGGDHADVEITADMGEAIAGVVLGGVSAVLDLGNFKPADQARFLIAFLDSIYDQNREPLMIVVDEADAYIPQQAARGQQQELLGSFDRIARRGRVRGLGLTIISQRAAAVHKNVLSQTELLIAHRMSGPQDAKAIDAWLSSHVGADQRREVLESLASLATGEAWVSSAAWLKTCRRIQVRLRTTYDSSSTPVVGQARTPITLAAIDIDALRAQLQATSEDAAANDPTALKERIEQLQRELAERPPTERVEVQILDPDQVERLRTIAAGLSEAGKDLCNVGQQLRVTASQIVDALRGPDERAPITDGLSPADNVAQAETLGVLSVENVPDPPSEEDPKSGSSISAPQQRILNALGSFEALGLIRIKKQTLAIFSDQSPISSGYTNNLSALRTLGLIEYPQPGMAALTLAGRSRVKHVAKPPTLAALHDGWCQRLSRPQARILRLLVKYRGQQIDKDAIANATDQSPTSSGFTNNLSALRTLGLIEYGHGRTAYATELLFPLGLK